MRGCDVAVRDASIRVEIYASDETVEIFVEADFETHAEERWCFAILAPLIVGAAQARV